MHHYQRNIGDYYKKAGRLSILQHGVYNLLIDACYDREKFPTRDEAIDWCWASTPEEEQAVDFVLRKFFEEQDDGTWVQNRILEELKSYWGKRDTQRKNGSKGGRPKKPNGFSQKPNGFSEKPNESQPPGKKSLTSNQEPVTSNQDPPIPPTGGELELGHTDDLDDPDALFADFWQDYPRKDGKQAALKAFKRRKPSVQFVDMLRVDIARRLHCGQWSLDDKQHIPHASTYLNGERWEDEYIQRARGSPRGEDLAAHNRSVVKSVWEEKL